MESISDVVLAAEFERQVDILIQKGYPAAAGLSEAAFRELFEPLRSLLDGLERIETNYESGKLPFVIVVKSDLIAAGQMMEMVEREGKAGFVKLFPHEPEDFTVIDEVEMPDGSVYLLADIDRGKDSLNVTPGEAFKEIREGGRSPLTIDEGIAVVTQHPDYLMRNNCFSMLGSRNPADKRVPAIWLTGKNQPRLGWCWDGNPHTWLGSASCGGRVGV